VYDIKVVVEVEFREMDNGDANRTALPNYGISERDDDLFDSVTRESAFSQLCSQLTTY
jgi:ATP-dependent DNA ligase